MRQVKQTLGWGGVFRAIFTLMVVPELANGFPLNPTYSRTLSKSAQTTKRRSDGQVSGTSVFDTLRNFTTHDNPTSRGPGNLTKVNRTEGEESIAMVIKTRTWPLGDKDNHEMHKHLGRKSQGRSTNVLLRRQRRTLISLTDTGSVSLSQNRSHIAQKTTANFETILPQKRRRRRRRSRTVLQMRTTADEQTSASLLNNSVTSYQGLNVSSRLSLTVNESNSLEEFNSSSDSMPSSSSWESSSSSYLADDVHVNRTNGMPYNGDYSRLYRNGSHGFNISNLLRMIKCQQNLTDSAEGGNDTSIRSRRRRRGVESEGCQVLHAAWGFIRVDPEGLVTTTWRGDDIYTRLYIFSIGPGYSRIKGIAADKYIHMDEAGAVYGIPSSEVPEPYDATNTKGAWYEAPGMCHGSRWIQWYRKQGARNELKWYLAFNWRGLPMRTQRTHADMCNASFMKTMSTGTSCNPNDGGFTNN